LLSLFDYVANYAFLIGPYFFPAKLSMAVFAAYGTLAAGIFPGIAASSKLNSEIVLGAEFGVCAPVFVVGAPFAGWPLVVAAIIRIEFRRLNQSHVSSTWSLSPFFLHGLG